MRRFKELFLSSILTIIVSADVHAIECDDAFRNGGSLEFQEILESIPVGRREASTTDDWYRDLDSAKVVLMNALAPSIQHWEAPAEEGLGKQIENPSI